MRFSDDEVHLLYSMWLYKAGDWAEDIKAMFTDGRFSSDLLKYSGVHYIQIFQLLSSDGRAQDGA